MIRVRMVAIFAAMIAVLAVSAAPAFARFVSTNGKATSPGKSTTIVLSGGGATLECATAEGTGTILSEGKEALSGELLLIDIIKWNSCKASSGSFKELKPKIKICSLRLHQPLGSSTATGSVATECTIETTVLFLTCTIHVTPEKESEKVNFGLEKNTLENSGSNLIINADDSGITTTTSGTCPGVKGGKENTQKATVTGEGAKWE
jgi:hypothetical protein